MGDIDASAEQSARRAALYARMTPGQRREADSFEVVERDLDRTKVMRLVRNAERDAAGDSPQDSDGWPEPLDLEALAEHEPEQPRFIIPDWGPCGYAWLLAGHGGVGKSIIALYLAVCVAAGLPFFGIEVGRRRVLYLACEDREGVLHWRLWRICAHLGIDLASLRGWLEVVDLVGRDAILWERDPRTAHTLTAAYGLLTERVREHETELLIVDGTSDTFGGNENSRGDVKRFVSSLVALIPADRGAVLLLGHIPKPTAANAATSEGYSGSTGWHNAVRARWYLYPETTKDEESDRLERTGELVLELQKSNFGRLDQEMHFRWDDGAHLFVGRRIELEGGLLRTIRDDTERKGILAALRGCAVTNPPIIVPSAMKGPRTAHHVLSLRPEFPDSLRAGKPAKRRFWRAIESLRQIHVLVETEYRRKNRHVTAQLVLTPEGVRQCAA